LKPKGAIISVDTRHAKVMQAALQAGASMINDVSALEDDKKSLPTLGASTAPVILMHKQGDPRSMQNNPSYNNVVRDVYDYLESRIQACMTAGIARERIIIDYGIGFGKTVEHNVELLRHTS